MKSTPIATWAAFVLATAWLASGPAQAQYVANDSEVWVPPQIDVIGPLGNRLPPSYRRQFNRPTYIGGKIARMVEPTSQEAITWQRANDAGLYDNNGIKGFFSGKKCPPQRYQQYFFYPKPWEVLTTGPRLASRPTGEDAVSSPMDRGSVQDDVKVELVPASPRSTADRDASDLRKLLTLPDDGDDLPPPALIGD